MVEVVTTTLEDQLIDPLSHFHLDEQELHHILQKEEVAHVIRKVLTYIILQWVKQ